jgi:hypothetical protein
MSPERQPPLAMGAHRPPAAHQLAEQTPFPRCVDALCALGHWSPVAIRFEQALGSVEKAPKTGTLEVASPMPGSWNQIAAWLEQIDAFRRVA